MKTKLISFLIIGLLCTTLLPSIMANDDVQILDNSQDVMESKLSKFFFPDQLVNTIDVLEAWFFEDPAEPEYLFVTIKISNLGPKFFHQIYGVMWRYNDVEYYASYHSMYFGIRQQAFGGKFARLNCNSISVSCDYIYEGALITIKVPKKDVGDPQPDDILTKPYAWTGIRFASLSFLNICVDYAGYNEEQYGLDYIITL